MEQKYNLWNNKQYNSITSHVMSYHTNSGKLVCALSYTQVISNCDTNNKKTNKKKTKKQSSNFTNKIDPQFFLMYRYAFIQSNCTYNVLVNSPKLYPSENIFN